LQTISLKHKLTRFFSIRCFKMRHAKGNSWSRRDFITALTVAGGTLAGSIGHDAQTPPSRKLGVALLGLGNYATGELGPALKLTRHCELRGIVTGTPSKVDKWVSEYGLDRKHVYNYETMDRLRQDPDIDIVYVVTPPGLHAEYSIRAARAGKHVISEKPMATSVSECERMIAACKEAKVKLGIGYRLHYDPFHLEMQRIATSGGLGTIKSMEGGFGYTLRNRDHRIVKALAGGGPLMDLGIYVVHAACMAMGGAPKFVTAKEDPKTEPEWFKEVEEGITWRLEFENGAVSDGMASFSKGANRFRVNGERDLIDLNPAFSYRGIQASTAQARMSFSSVSQQALQMDDFAQCVLNHTPSRVPGELGLRDIKILMAIYEAARTGKRVAISA